MRLIRAIRQRATYANVMSTIAVFVALTTGTAFAAANISGLHVRNGSLTGADIRNNSITSADAAGLRGIDVVNGSLSGADIKDGSIGSADVAGLTGVNVTDGTLGIADFAAGDRAALQGPAGPPGAPGGTGPAGPAGSYTIGSGLSLSEDETTLSVRFGTTESTVAAGDDPRLSDSRTPIGAAGGVLSGTYPNPQFKADAVAPDAAKLGGVVASSYKAVCPSGPGGSVWTGSVCLSQQIDKFTGTWYQSMGWCRSIFSKGRLATYAELIHAAQESLITLVVGEWTADTAGDDHVIYINSTDPTNADGVRARNTTSVGARCAYAPRQALGTP